MAGASTVSDLSTGEKEQDVVSKRVRRIGLATVGVVVMAAGVLLATGTSAGAHRPLAAAKLHNDARERIGVVVFKGSGGYAERVQVKLKLPAGAPGLDAYHGLHLHQTGECVAPFTSAGGHWNLDPDADHGTHTGDLPSMLVSDEGRAYAEFDTHRFDVAELFDEDGSAVILHAGPDNFANVPIEDGKYADPNDWYNAPGGTAATGDAGGRYGCGVVESRGK